MALSGTGKSNKAQACPDAEQKIRRKLWRWFKRHGRDLPWRRTDDPYAILVSEFMLQQTTVSAVIPYFARWMARFPTLASLARSAEEDVLQLWQGLGYYGRAHNLRQVAVTLVKNGRSKVPNSVAELRSLPGVGDYTAAAVASFAFDAVEPLIDANIGRVLARLRNWKAPIDDPAGRAFLLQAARDLLPKSGGRLHSSALMELGALVCVARNPRCRCCPLRRECAAERPDQLPVKKPPRPIEQVTDARAFILERGRLWLERAPGTRWRGMWVLPETNLTERCADHVERYFITRFHVTMRTYVESRRDRNLEGYALESLPPMPSAHRRTVAAMLQRVHSRR
jgi:A/G-specific adenine glycosylase